MSLRKRNEQPEPRHRRPQGRLRRRQPHPDRPGRRDHPPHRRRPEPGLDPAPVRRRHPRLRPSPGRQGPGSPAALRHPLRHQGQHRPGRSADHGRLPRIRLYAGAQRLRRPVPDRRRRDPHRQDQPRPVRHRPQRHPLALGRRTQRLQPGLHLGRLQLRLGGRRGAGLRELRPGHRHRRLRPGAGRVQQPRRPQAQPRLAVGNRPGAGLPLARHDLGLRPDRRGRRGGHDGRRGLRPGRRLLAQGRRSRLRLRQRGRLPGRHPQTRATEFLRQHRGRAPVRRGRATHRVARRRVRRVRPAALPRHRQAALRRPLGGRALCRHPRVLRGQP